MTFGVAVTLAPNVELKPTEGLQVKAAYGPDATRVVELFEQILYGVAVTKVGRGVVPVSFDAK